MAQTVFADSHETYPVPLSTMKTRTPRLVGFLQSREAKTCNLRVPSGPRASSAFTTRLEVRKPRQTRAEVLRNGVQTGSSGEHLRWLNGDQYMEGSEIERAITIGSKALDSEIAEQEHVYERN